MDVTKLAQVLRSLVISILALATTLVVTSPGIAAAGSIEPPIPAGTCPGGVGAITDIDQDDDSGGAGVTWSSEILISAPAGGTVVVLFRNDGPGSITFSNTGNGVGAPGSWSDAGTPINKGIPTVVGGGIATFSDGTWGGTFAEGFILCGVVSVTGISDDLDLQLSFTRAGTTHTINVEFEIAD